MLLRRIKGSSETTREKSKNKTTMNFNLKNFYTLLPQHKNEKSISPEFLTWFIGFVEGDGSFQKNGTLKITQSSTDIQILYRVKTTMGFGTVRIQDSKFKAHC